MAHKYHQGQYRPINPKKYKGDPTNIMFRSSWEMKLMLFIDRNPQFIQWSSEETIIPYRSPIDGRRHRYFVDFWCKFVNNKGVVEEWLIEVKPKAQTIEPKVQQKKTKKYINEVLTYGVNIAKWQAAEEYCQQRGWKFKIFTEDDFGFK